MARGELVYISEIRIENFRLFGSGADAFVLPLNPGLTAIIGENDAGKTALIDALRIVLGTRDQELVRLEPSDFHQATSDEARAEQISVRLTFSALTLSDISAFAEFLTYLPGSAGVERCMVVTWVAKRSAKDGGRRYIPNEWRTGVDGEGPLLDPGARALLTATYLRPLRDAERAMGAGRGSRLSQILQHTKEVKESGKAFKKDEADTLDPKTLSVLGLGDYANFLLGENQAITAARKKLNEEYLAHLAFANDHLNARIGVSGSRDEAVRLRQLLEKLEVQLAEADSGDDAHTRGLGSNNLLFMACELLLLATESDGFPILLIEEPEAHLHPQRQLRLMSFLQAEAMKRRADGQQIQIIVTTHSPNLASEIPLNNMVLLNARKAFPLMQGATALDGSDYRFLERFLDVTKANLFFARAVLIVEGDAENILLPEIARLLARDFAEYGVSVVNVGGVGLGRYARILMRSQSTVKNGLISIPVACMTDMDVMPECAVWIAGYLKKEEPIPALGSGTRRRWRYKGDFPDNTLADYREEKRKKVSGQRIDTFVSDEWTLEYDLAFYGLGAEVWTAARCALVDDQLNTGKLQLEATTKEAAEDYQKLRDAVGEKEELASHIYSLLAVDGASKSITAQYLSSILEELIRDKTLTPDDLRRRLPPYIVRAIEHVTTPFLTISPEPDGETKAATS